MNIRISSVAYTFFAALIVQLWASSFWHVAAQIREQETLVGMDIIHGGNTRSGGKTVLAPDEKTQHIRLALPTTDKEFSLQNTTHSCRAYNLSLNGQALSLESHAPRGSLEAPFVPLLLPNAAPFIALSVALGTAALASHENFHVLVRPVNEHGEFLGDWLHIPFDHHAENGANAEEQLKQIQPDRIAQTNDYQVLRTHLALLPKETHAIHLRIIFSRSVSSSSLSGKTPSLWHLEIFAHNPGASDESFLRTIRQENNSSHSEHHQEYTNASTIQNNNLFGKNVGAIIQNAPFPRPRFVTRTDWGCPWGQTSGPNILTSTPPTHLIVHHSFSPGNTVTDWPAAVRSVWNFHVNSNGWSDIGYNWLIDPDGIIYQGRAWVDSNDNTQGAHFCGFNRNTMGVCMLGDFNTIAPSQSALRSLVRLLAYRASSDGIDARSISYHATSQRNLYNISGHRDGCATDCPGNMQYPLLPTVRKRVYALLNPPLVQEQAASILSREVARLSCRVQPKGSETAVYVEWDVINGDSAHSGVSLSNRRLVQNIGENTEELEISTTLDNLDPTRRYAYRFIAQNSDTLTITRIAEFSTMSTGAGAPYISSSSLAGSSSGLLWAISPNPAHNEASLWFRVEEFAREVEVQLCSSTGIVLSTIVHGKYQVGDYQLPLSLHSLASGVYYCRMYLSGEPLKYAILPLVVLR